jgi:hypothetical protein
MNDKLFINLKILGNIQKNGKIARSYDGVISLEHDSYFQSLKRFINSDSRKQTIHEIKSIVNETSDAFSNIFQSRKYDKYSNPLEYTRLKDMATLLFTELEVAKIGIENLKFTYISDLNTSSQIDIVLMKINTILKEVNDKLDIKGKEYTTENENDSNSCLIPI